MKKNIFVLFALLVCGAPLFGADGDNPELDAMAQALRQALAERQRQKEMRRQGPPPIAPKPKPRPPVAPKPRPKSPQASCESCAQAAPQPPRAKVGGAGDRWLKQQQQRALPQAERERQADRDAEFALEVLKDQLAEQERQDALFLQQMLAAEAEAEKRQREEQAAQDARYAQLLSQEGQRPQASGGPDLTEDEALARALEMSLGGQGSELLRLEQERLLSKCMLMDT